MLTFSKVMHWSILLARVFFYIKVPFEFVFWGWIWKSAEAEAWRFQLHTPFHRLCSSCLWNQRRRRRGNRVIDIIKSGKTDDGFNGIPLKPQREIHESAMNKSAKVYLHGFQICCHSTLPIKEIWWISVRTLNNKSLISTDKIDPLKKAAHRSLTRQWVLLCCCWKDVVDWTTTFLNGLWSAHHRLCLSP